METGKSLTYSFFNDREATFTLNNGTPSECERIDAVKQWIELALRVLPDTVPIYRHIDGVERFGVNIYQLLSQRSLPKDFVKAEIQREISETCAMNPNIESVSDFAFNRGKRRTLEVSFNVKTKNEESGAMTIELNSE